MGPQIFLAQSFLVLRKFFGCPESLFLEIRAAFLSIPLSPKEKGPRRAPDLALHWDAVNQKRAPICNP